MIHDFPHAIMFHHFHSSKHPSGQGSIDSSTFCKMIKWLKNNYNLLSAEVFYHKSVNRNLQSGDICLSFDDALLCQYDIALPVLEKEKIKAFFFIYSAPLKGKAEKLEVYRYFRCVEYSSTEKFYSDFFDTVKEGYKKKYNDGLKKFDKASFLKEYRFYSLEDKWFRYIRDFILNKNQYDNTMFKIMKKRNFNYTKLLNKLWMSELNIKSLNTKQHIIGLHSYNHPTMINSLSHKKQEKEYKMNKKHLESIIYPNIIKSMSHPCGRYNKTTLNILKTLDINIGFTSNCDVEGKAYGLLEIPREDHSNILKYMKS